MTLVLCLSTAAILAPTWLAAEEEVITNPAVEAGSSNIIPIFPADVTPEERSRVITTLQNLTANEKNLLPLGEQDPEQFQKRVHLANVAAATEFYGYYDQMFGLTPDGEAAAATLGGRFRLDSAIETRAPNMRPERYLAYPSAYQIVSSETNIAHSTQERLDKLKGKIPKAIQGCEGFDWTVQLAAKFNSEALKKWVDNLGESALSAAPMAFLANWSPTTYEIVKMLRMVASGELDADRVSCTTMMGPMKTMFGAMTRGPHYAQCMNANEHLGSTEAFKICAGEDSWFNGLENRAGQIMGFNGELESISFTQMAASGLSAMTAPTVDAATSIDLANAEADIEAAQVQYDQAAAKLAATPDPGPVAPVGGTREQRSAYTAAQTARKTAENDLAKAREALSKANQKYTALDNGATSWAGRLGPVVADNLVDLVGDISISAKGDLTLGQTDKYRLRLRFEAFAYDIAKDFTDALWNHRQRLVSESTGETEMAASYRELSYYTWNALQDPWPNEEDWPAQIPHPEFTFRTLDRLAIMWAAYRLGDAQSVARREWPAKFRYMECINLLTQYEVWENLRLQFEKERDRIVQAFVDQVPQESPAMKKVVETVIHRLDVFGTQTIPENRRAVLRRLAEAINAVNQFPLNFRDPPKSPTLPRITAEGQSPRLGN